ncbi:hypothetical protein [Nocardioides sp. cx-173]|uniref:hypothetical protein n=1 Tax=Nocardioides sp. cx-173 TaxID=2898796 RepID=UPI001E542C3B|nr:hypothetical protein [Nocardioides sp. cx-173]MCD4526971.1 hypothetical protein [Nocardioides sp. cx-173]UGB41094.1 hypothetical protein LQ940_17195 [Nocardioides sp. cx-173]
MRARTHGALAAVLVVLLGLGLAGAVLSATTASASVVRLPAVSAEETEPTETPTETPSETATETAEPESGAFTISDAQLRWGINNETNNKAFAPGTFNFLSAGTVPNPGAGGQTITNATWRGTGTRAWWAERGAVRIEKRRPDGSYGAATFAGLSTDVDGNPLTSTNGPFSGHQVVLDGGTGEVDTDARTATIRWRGSFSVVYYSGMSFFTVTDPVLTVTRSSATLRATLSGYASSVDDQSLWSPVPPEVVTIADLPVPDLTAAGGFAVQPRYLNVRYQAPSSGAAQVRTGSAWGAFPSSFLAYMDKVGSAAFWYSSGGAADAHKVPSPVAISYVADDPIEPPVAPTTGPGPTAPEGPQPSTPVNPTRPPVQPAPPALPAPPAAPAPALPSTPAAPAPGEVGLASAPLPAAPTVYALASSEPASREDAADHRWTWWLGSLLLLGTAGLSVLTHQRKASS